MNKYSFLDLSLAGSSEPLDQDSALVCKNRRLPAQRISSTSATPFKGLTNTNMVSNSSRPHPQEEPSPPYSAGLRKLQAAEIIYCLFQPTPAEGATVSQSLLEGGSLNLISASQQTQLGITWTNPPFYLLKSLLP